MKKIILIFVIVSLFSGILKAKKPQVTLPERDGVVIYTEVVEVDGVTKGDLFARGMEWVAKNYVSANHVVQFKDKEAGTIVGKANLRVYIKNPIKFNFGVVKYTVSLYLKDGKYKYEFTDFYHDGTTSEYYGGKSYGPIMNEKTKWSIRKKQWNTLK